MERRRFMRIPFHTDAVLRQGVSVWPTNIEDLSLKGALINLPPEFDGDTNQPFILCFKLEGQANQILMEGSIKRLSDQTIGFAVEQMDIESATELRRLVALNLGDETLVNRDLEALAGMR